MKPRTASTLAIVTVAAAIELAGTADPAISAQERPAAQSARVVLDGNGLGVTRYGATRASATKALTAVLGKPTGHPAADCTGKYRDTAWHDLVVQFLNGRLHGYRYPDGRRGVAPTRSVLKSVKPKLKTTAGITLGSTLGDAEHAYDHKLKHVATGSYATKSGITFSFWSSGTPSDTSPIYEVKSNFCPASV